MSEKIAISFFAHDESQIEYYTEIMNNMVGPVLRDRGVMQRNRNEALPTRRRCTRGGAETVVDGVVPSAT
jgi:hypothetical protein